MADWLEFLLLTIIWTPVLVLLHELGHAAAAVVLTDGEVRVELRSAGLDGGSATYDGDRLRRARDAVWIAAAGPAVSLAAACVLWYAWWQHPTYDGGGVAFVGAWVATGHFLGSALPIRYGAGLRGAMESDGRVIWRILAGAPPGGIERELRRQGEPEPAARPLFVVLLALAGVLGLLADPWLLVGLAVLFGLGLLMQQKT